MITFSLFDLIIIFGVLLITLIIGIVTSSKVSNSADDYLLSGRKVGLFLFVLTNVSTWYGGILGIGEFSYRYGIAAWTTQGLPYYIFAIIFALIFAKKIRNASLFTIPDRLGEKYGPYVQSVSAVLVFVLVSPAPYLLMIGSLFSLITGLNVLTSMTVIIIPMTLYIVKGGLKTNIFTDVFLFFIMFGGFALGVGILVMNYGGLGFLSKNLSPQHLSLQGEVSNFGLLIWFLIALWTFADPGFHQRTFAAKNWKVARNGILISVIFWLLFDFLTNSTGLYAKALLPNLENPVLAFPLLAEKVFSSGAKGFFFAALIATILSTLNSFIFLSATTISKDFLSKFDKTGSLVNIKRDTVYGMILTVVVSIALAHYIPSVIQLWYLIGSFCIPGIIFLIIGAYYPKYSISEKFALIEICIGVFSSIIWYFIKQKVLFPGAITEIEPMLAGLGFAFIVHLLGMFLRRRKSS